MTQTADLLHMGSGPLDYLSSRREGRLNIAAVGRTGDGKSSTLNSIMRLCRPTPVLFRSVGGAESVTKQYDQREVQLLGLSVRLIDTMGLFDTEFTEDVRTQSSLFHIPDMHEDHRQVLLELSKVIQLCSDGVDAFLFVVNGAGRFTTEARDTLKIIVEFFGTSMLNHCIFILTNKDNADFNRENMRDQVNNYLRRIGVPQAADHQFIGFDNRSTPPPMGQVEQLFEAVAAILQRVGGHPYENVTFQRANKELKEKRAQLQADRKSQLDEEISQKTAEITREFQQQNEAAMQKIWETEDLMSRMSEENKEERKMAAEHIKQMTAQMEKNDKKAQKAIKKAREEAEAKAQSETNDRIRRMEEMMAQNMSSTQATINALTAQMAAMGNKDDSWCTIQ